MIRSRWVVTNKGSDDHPNVRARWVAQEFKSMDGPDHGKHYAATPGLDLVKGVLGHAASLRSRPGTDVVVAVVDVRRAYFYAKPQENTYVELPDYFDAETRRTHCAKLCRCLYGTRQAARAWQRELEGALRESGVTVGTMSRCTFRSECGQLVGTVHGDDILLAGPRDLVVRVRGSLRKRYETREQWMGGQPGEPKEVSILNRTVEWVKEGLRLAADRRHACDIIEELGLENAKAVDTPVPVTQRDPTEDEVIELDGVDAAQYRRLAAKLNYLSMDRPDVRYAASLICGRASRPRVLDLLRLKRVARFLLGRPVMWTYFKSNGAGNDIAAYTDADWAGCRETRRSVSGGMVLHNGSLLKFWSRRQKAISLSSWESELYAGVTAGI